MTVTAKLIRESVGALAIAALASGLAACSHSSETQTGPSPVKCQVSLSTSATPLDAGGAAGSVTVTTQPECAWTASADVTWIGGLSPVSGQGDGRVDFQVPSNPGPSMRQGDVVINGSNALVRQEGSPCRFDITPANPTAPAAGGTMTLAIATASGCVWTAASNADWITIASGAQGSGNASVNLTVAGNSGSTRTAVVTIAGQGVTVTQQAAGAGASCAATLSPATAALPASGGGGPPITVEAADGCDWVATADTPWITFTSRTDGKGAGVVTFSASANTGSARAAVLTIGGTTFAVEQASGNACAYSVTPTTQSIESAGGTAGPFAVTTASGCQWTAASAAPWITMPASGPRSGNGSLSVAVAANAGSARAGTLTVAGRIVTITQAAASCSFELSPASQPVAAAGGSGLAVTVTTGANCTWTASTTASWITITKGASGTGAGTVTIAVDSNPGAARTGTVSVGGQVATVAQEAAIQPPPTQLPPTCSFTVLPTSQLIAAAGGAGSPVSVTTSSGCMWTATSNAPWLTITSGASGTGGGNVAFSAAANSGAERMGTLTIAGQTFTVTQAQACSFAINPTTQSISATGGAGTSIAVTAAAGCSWTAASNASWLTITSGASGNGNGSVAFTVGGNSGSQRSGTLTVAGQTFAVTQAAASANCSSSIAPTSQSIAAAGGAGSPVTVTTSSGCMWTATANAPWLTITSGASGNGGGSVAFSAAPNTGSQRTGTLTIAGQTFTVTQAQACSYSINPTTQSIAAGGGAGTTITVTAAAGCSWTAASNAQWLTIASGASSGGNGNGSVAFTVAPNSGSERTGTLTVAGQTFTVTQAAAPPSCSYSIAPTSQTITRAGGDGTPVTVTTTSACEWTATSNDSWITITSGTGGKGNGTVNFTVARLGNGQRTGTLTIAGHPFTVTQAGGGS